MNILRFLNLTFRLFLLDFSGRSWGILCQGLGNIFPDLFVFSSWRVAMLRMSGAKISGVGTIIRKGLFIEFPKNMIIGQRVQFNRDVYIASNDMVIIEDGVRIGSQVKLITISHEGEHFEKDKLAPIHLKKNSHLGAGCIILPGTIIEEGVMVAPNAVLQGETKPMGVYIGNPARLITKRITSEQV